MIIAYLPEKIIAYLPEWLHDRLFVIGPDWMLSWSECSTRINSLGLSLGIQNVTNVPTRPKKKTNSYLTITYLRSSNHVQTNCQSCRFPKKTNV